MKQESDEYYVPTLDEFVDGFEYEYKARVQGSFCIMDFSTLTCTDNEDFDYESWTPATYKIYTYPYTHEYNGFTVVQMAPYPEETNEVILQRIQSLLDDNSIRAKK